MCLKKNLLELMFYLDILYLLLNRDSPYELCFWERVCFCLQALLHLGHRIKSVTDIFQNTCYNRVVLYFLPFLPISTFRFLKHIFLTFKGNQAPANNLVKTSGFPFNIRNSTLCFWENDLNVNWIIKNQK